MDSKSNTKVKSINCIPLKKIGIFDSGIGGISILQQIMHLPGFEFIYYADTAHVPYGKRPQEEIQKLSYAAIQCLADQNVEIIIIACHTVATNALEFLKKKFPQLYFIDVVELLVEQVKDSTSIKKIGILATKATAKSAVHKKKLLENNPHVQIFMQACPRLASAIEKNYSDTPKLIKLINRYLQPLKAAHIDTLLLGCTHYALLQGAIRKALGPTVQLISAESIIKDRLEPLISQKLPPSISPSIQWFITGNRNIFKKTVHSILIINLEKISKITLT
jgi:glutamate racemase